MSGVHPGLVVGIPFCGRPVSPEWALSLATQNWPMGVNIMYLTLKGMEVGKARDTIVEQALQNEAKYIWFVDDDTAPPHFAIKKLIRVMEEDPTVMVCGGIYCSRHGENLNEPIVFKRLGEGVFWHWKIEEIFECEGLGTGCMLIRTEIFKQMPKPWFVTVDKDMDGSTNMTAFKETDDLYFCRKVREAGFRIVAHGGVLPIHWDAMSGVPYVLPQNSYPLQVTDSIDRAMAIDGWMDKPELVWLATQAKRYSNIVELGSFQGRSTRILAENTKGTVTAIDDWSGPRATMLYLPGNPVIFDKFQENCKDLIDKGKIIIQRTDHANVKPKPESVDMVFIDGDHSYGAVCRDIEIWRKALKPEGLLCGHDWDTEDVSRAVKDRLPDVDTVPGTRLWFWEKKKVGLSLDDWKERIRRIEESSGKCEVMASGS